MIPKESKDSTSCARCPFFFLNVDLKLLMNILANRMFVHIASIMDLVQVGFLPSRDVHDIFEKVLNLIHFASNSKTSCLFLSTDTVRAFNRVNWLFMTKTLRFILLVLNVLNELQ